MKKNGQGAVPVAKVLCLAKDCVEMIQPYLPLCKLCYLQSMAGKVSVLALRDGLGDAVFNNSTKKLDFPAGVPKSRFPQKDLKKGKKILMARHLPSTEDAEDGQKGKDGRATCLPCASTNQELAVAVFPVLSAEIGDRSCTLTNQEVGIAVDGDDTTGFVAVPSGSPSTMKCLFSGGVPSALLYVDSGAGQSLSSCSTAFSQMVPCQVEITGIAGALQIYGCGTASFLYDGGSDNPVILRVHNCRREIRIALAVEDGLFAIPVTPFQMDDPRFATLPKFDVTPNGEFKLSGDDLLSHSSMVFEGSGIGIV